MALIEFKNLPDTTTPINAQNLNNNFNECGADTGWITLNSVIKYRKIGKIVYIAGLSQNNVTVGGDVYITIGTLPTNFKPSNRVDFTVHYIGGIHNGQSNYIDTNGDIKMYLPLNDSAEYWGFSVSFPI